MIEGLKIRYECHILEVEQHTVGTLKMCLCLHDTQSVKEKNVFEHKPPGFTPTIFPPVLSL